MLDYRGLEALAEVIRRRSFEGAAEAMGLTQSAVSQRIRALEQRLGQVLLDRGPPIRGTQAGLQLAAHLDRVHLLEATLGQAQTPPMIRIAVTADSLASWAMEALPAAPGLVDLVIDDQDHAENWLRAGQVSAAITAQPRPVAGCSSHVLGKMRYIATASPDFIARHFAGGITAETLAAAPALRFNAKDALQDRWAQQVTGQKPVLRHHLIPDARAFLEATRAGMGWGLNPEPLIKWDLSLGRLAPLLPDAPLDVPLFWQVQRIMTEPLRPLTYALWAASAKALRRD